MSQEKLDESAGDAELKFSDLGDSNHDVAEESDNKRFVRYKVEVGRGAFKTVYKGYDTDEGVEVAWNKLPTQKMQEKDRNRVREEIGILKKMDHPNILRCNYAWVDPTTNDVNFITELMTSGSLRE
jgi:WNK lysine deficient protein kinase